MTEVRSDLADPPEDWTDRPDDLRDPPTVPAGMVGAGVAGNMRVQLQLTLLGVLHR